MAGDFQHGRFKFFQLRARRERRRFGDQFYYFAVWKVFLWVVLEEQRYARRDAHKIAYGFQDLSSPTKTRNTYTATTAAKTEIPTV